MKKKCSLIPYSKAEMDATFLSEIEEKKSRLYLLDIKNIYATKQANTTHVRISVRRIDMIYRTSALFTLGEENPLSVMMHSGAAAAAQENYACMHLPSIFLPLSLSPSPLPRTYNPGLSRL